MLPGRDAGRNQEILAAIVRTHIATGEPVASMRVARQQHGQLSSATIRNVMVHLENKGYLRQPHTSAGRIPTAKAYEFYARQAMRRAQLAPSDRNWIDAHLLGEPMEAGALLPRASRVLSELVHGIGIVFTIPVMQAPLEQVCLLRVDTQRVLVVILTRTGLVRDTLVTVQEAYSQEELDRTAAYLNQNFAGWTLAAARAELERRAAHERSRYERLAATAAALCRESVEEIHETAKVYLEGTANLIARAAEASQEELSVLLRTLEEKEKLVGLLSITLEQLEPGVQVMIGLQRLAPAIKHFALISASYGTRERPLGSLAILGPTRMDYPRAITAVHYVARLFNRVLNEN
ncbi:MAG: heat-inducible transcriptional repressor HrcA [Terriglobia bacterium]